VPVKNLAGELVAYFGVTHGLDGQIVSSSMYWISIELP
jgi:hypothetical protein